MKSQLPLGLAVIAAYEIIAGSLGVVLSAVLFVLSAPVWSTIIACFIVLWVSSGFAFLVQKQWAWKLGMIVSIVSFLGSILLFSLVQSFLLFFGPGLILWPLAIIYLSRPRIKNLFARARMTGIGSSSSG